MAGEEIRFLGGCIGPFGLGRSERRFAAARITSVRIARRGDLIDRGKLTAGAPRTVITRQKVTRAGQTGRDPAYVVLTEKLLVASGAAAVRTWVAPAIQQVAAL